MFCESVKVCAHATVVTVVLDRWLKQALSTDDFGPIGEPKSVAVVVAAVLLWKRLETPPRRDERVVSLWAGNTAKKLTT